MKSITRGVVVNATPLGMNDELIDFVDLSMVDKFLDVVVKDTPTARAARNSGIPAFTGETMALFQAERQFNLYTGQKAPLSAMIEALRHANQKP